MPAPGRLTAEDGPRTVLMFHGIGTPHAGVPDEERPYWCGRDNFLRLLDRLHQLASEGSSPVEITFDDGNRSDLDIAAPALAERDLGASFFVCAGRLKDAPYLGPDDLRALRDAGMRVGSHGMAHRNLRSTTPEDLREEAETSAARISEILGAPCDGFAIPFGSYDRRVLSALAAYSRVYCSDSAPTTGNERPIPRLTVMQDWTVDRLDAELTQRRSALFALKSLAKRLR